MDESKEHEIDQTTAEPLATGNMERVGSDRFQFTVKGLTRETVTTLMKLVEDADRESRDFTVKERKTVWRHMSALQEALRGKR